MSAGDVPTTLPAESSPTGPWPLSSLPPICSALLLVTAVATGLPTAAAADWPEFRGPNRDSAVLGIKLQTDWNEAPPKLLWEWPIGAGWSSMAVVGRRLYTQEQRDEQEVVLCLDNETGDEVWSHADEYRFDESMGGPGPRATPTFSAGRVYALGAGGILNCLDADSGKLLWSRDIKQHGHGSTPPWGFSSSPLVVNGKVIVYAGGGGKLGKAQTGIEQQPADGATNVEAPKNPSKNSESPPADALLAYDAESGDLAWTAPAGEHSYASAQVAVLCGVEQILFPADDALRSYNPEDGRILWSLASTAKESMPTLQPHILSDDTLLAVFSATGGLHRVHVTLENNAWQVESVWNSRDMKPFFNDLVRADGVLYGFDGSIFSAVDADTGKRLWKKGRYGSGQVLLLADQPALLVLSDKGEVALVAADPDEHRELGRFKAIKGKSWNHPVIANGKLFVRNAETIACFELVLAP